MNSQTTTERYVQVPVRVRGHLPGGRLHRMRVGAEGLRFSTLPGLYGNKASQIVLDVPFADVEAVEYRRPLLMSGTGRCRVRYTNHVGRRRTMEFRLVVSWVQPGDIPGLPHQNAATEQIVHLIAAVWKDDLTLPHPPIVLEYQPLDARKKWLYGLLLVGALIGWAMLTSTRGRMGVGIGVLATLAPLLLTMSGVALAIDHVRLHTSWHWMVKIAVYAAVFVVGFTIFIAVMVLLDPLYGI